MATWLKVVLIVVGVIVVLVIGVVVVGVVVYYKGGGREIVEGMTPSIEEGQKYGRTAENKACVNEAIVRFKRDSTTVNGLLGSKGFLTGCLQTSRETPNFCQGVPGPFDVSDGVRWKKDQCSDHGLGSDQNCPQLFDAVIQHCQSKR
jgi:hypothetical protein